MKKKLALILAVLILCFSGCVNKPEETEPAQTEQTVQTEQTTEPVQTETEAEPTVPIQAELPEEIVTPEEMPTAPEADAEVPPQPQPTIITE